MKTDATQINIGETKLYPSSILEMFNRKVIFHNISSYPNLEQIYYMLDKDFDKFINHNGSYFIQTKVGSTNMLGIERNLKNAI